MILYECQGNSQHLYEMAKEGGGMCNRQMLPCNAIVAAWVKGSKVRRAIQVFIIPFCFCWAPICRTQIPLSAYLCVGAPSTVYPVSIWTACQLNVCCAYFIMNLPWHWFYRLQSFTFPPDVGYALESRYYLMETHYSDMEPPKDLESLQADPVPDYSGLKLYYTAARKYDAGVLSIGTFYASIALRIWHFPFKILRELKWHSFGAKTDIKRNGKRSCCCCYAENSQWIYIHSNNKKKINDENAFLHFFSSCAQEWIRVGGTSFRQAKSVSYRRATVPTNARKEVFRHRGYPCSLW